MLTWNMLLLRHSNISVHLFTIWIHFATV